MRKDTFLKRAYAEAINEDELDFYQDLLEKEITIQDIETHIGEDEAKHAKKFMEEHGLI